MKANRRNRKIENQVGKQFDADQRIMLENKLLLAANVCKQTPQRPVYAFFKRLFDVVSAAAALVVLFVPLLVVGIIIRLDSPGGVIYKQLRVGKDGRLFMMYKFRSMYVDAESRQDELQEDNMMSGPMFKIKNDPRITKIGKFIRRYSIDELPQLINIIKGDMSVVGPRPPLPREVMDYDEAHMIRLSVIGGLTCYWQISGRSDSSFEECLSLDIRYISERSFWRDLYIILQTVPAAVSGQGAY